MFTNVNLQYNYVNMSKQDERAFIAISGQAHKKLKKFVEKRGYLISGFTERAVLEKMERELQLEESQKAKLK